MPRLRALLAVLLAVTWCSAAWHVDLEAIGLMLDHQHHSHDDATGADHHTPVGAHDDHDPFLARGVVKDGQIRVGAGALPWSALAGVFVACGIALGRDIREREPVPIEGRTDPPLAHVWHFVQRCAPESAAPPALG